MSEEERIYRIFVIVCFQSISVVMQSYAMYLLIIINMGYDSRILFYTWKSSAVVIRKNFTHEISILIWMYNTEIY